MLLKSEHTMYVNRGCNLLNILLSIPVIKLPLFEQSNNGEINGAESLNSAENKRKQAAKKPSKSEILLALSENPLLDLLNTSTGLSKPSEVVSEEITSIIKDNGEINGAESLNSAGNKRKQADKKPTKSEIQAAEVLLDSLGITHESENPLPDLSNTTAAIDWLSKVSEEIEEITLETKEIAPYTKIDLGDVTRHNIKLLKKVNQVVFPIVYNDKFYKDVLESGEYAKLAYYNDVVVGAVCCRVDVTKGQIISECPYELIVCPKIATKKFLRFLP